jgi:hypothetical protein
MKKTFFILFVFLSTTLFGQTQWQPMYLTVSGNHVVNGVEGWFGTVNCNGTDQVVIKFVNTNSSAAVLHWYDGVFTQSKEWIYHSDPAAQKTLRLEGKSSQEGSCSGVAVLVIEPADFGILIKDFFRYNAMELNVTIE